jgi:hypothetical protein
MKTRCFDSTGFEEHVAALRLTAGNWGEIILLLAKMR